MHERVVGHRLANVAKSIGQSLELLAISSDGKISLNQVMKLGIKVDGHALHIVPEYLFGTEP